MRTPAEREAWIKKGERIASHLLDALDTKPSAIDRGDDEQIRHWINHNELGLALEEFLLAAAGTPLSDETGRALDAAASDMGGETGLWRLPSAQLVERLKQRGFT